MKIETIKSSGGSTMSYCPERGGIITSINFHGTEILYLEQETFENPAVNVKGGIPILFPNAGPIPDPSTAPAEFAKLAQHGFARTSLKWNHATLWNTFLEDLKTNDETINCYPYSFTLMVIGEINERTCSITTTVNNPNLYKCLPVSMGLHPYFRIPKGTRKEDIRFMFEGGNILTAGIDKWANGTVVSIANPRLLSSSRSPAMEIFITGLGRLCLEASREYERIWVWSLPGKDFICIEPVMRDKGAIVTNPVKIAPGAEISASFSIGLHL